MNTFTNALLATSVLALSLDSLAEYGLTTHEPLELPGDLCCRFFGDSYYATALQFDDYCITDLSGENNYLMGRPNSKKKPDYYVGIVIASYVCGKNVALDVCDDPPEQTDRRCETMTAGHVMNPSGGLDRGSARWIAMEYYDPATNGAVTTFEYQDCSGSSDRYFGAPNYPQEAFYQVFDFTQNSGSVHVPYGYTLITYSDRSLQTPLEIIIGDYDDHLLQKPKCQNLAHPISIYDNEVQGWKVIRNRDWQSLDPAVGFWKSLLVSTESQEFEYHVGTSNTESAGSSSENAASLQSNIEGFTEMTSSQQMERAISNGIAASVSVGGSFKMFDFSASTEVERTESASLGSSQSVSLGRAWGQEQGVSSLVAQDVQVSMQEDYGIVHKTTCKAEGATGAGLYQFILMSSDGKASLSTPHIVCRTGEHWNTPPACTWDACKNADCTCCEGDPDC